MGVTVAVTRVACNTSTGTQDITTSDMGGLTPKAAIFIVGSGVTDATAAAHARMSFGATDGTRQFTVDTVDEDNVATTDSNSDFDTSRCVFMPSKDGFDDGYASFSAWLTNGVRINWDNAPGSAYLLTVILFGGTDLSVYVDAKSVGNTVDLTTDITEPGFTPDVVFAALGRGFQVPGQMNLGLVHYDGVSTVTQRMLSINTDNGVGTTEVGAYGRSDSGISEGNQSNPGELDWRGEFGDFDANGFSITTRVRAGNSRSLCYVALSFGGAVDSWVGTHTTPTATGNDSETGPSFTPQFVMMHTSLIEAVDTIYTDNRGGSAGVSVFTSTVEYTNVISMEDNVGTSNTQHLADDRAIVVPDDDGTLDIEATFVSMDANGWTVNYSNAPATAKLFFALAIEEEDAGISISVTTAITIGETTTVDVSDPQVSASTAVTVGETIAAILVHLVNVSSAVTIGETTAATLVHLVNVSSAVTVADTPALEITPEIGQSSAVSIAETITVALSDNEIAVSEAVTIGETISPLLVSLVSQSSAVSIAETIEAILVHLISASSGVTIGETISPLLVSLVTVSSAITIDEAVSVSIVSAGDVSASASTGITIADSPTVEITLEISVSSAVTIAETTSPLLVHLIDVSSAVTVAETIEAILVYLVNVSSAVSVADAPTTEVIVNVNVSSAITIGESVTVSISTPGVTEISVSSSITIGETVTAEITPEISVSSAITIGESVSPLLVHLVAASSAVTVAETIAALLESLIAQSSAITIGETVTTALSDNEIAVSESITIADSPNVALAGTTLTIAVASAVTVADAPGLQLVYLVNTSEAITIGETVTIDPLLIILALSEAIAISESVNMQAAIINMRNKNALFVQFRDKRLVVERLD